MSPPDKRDGPRLRIRQTSCPLSVCATVKVLAQDTTVFSSLHARACSEAALLINGIYVQRCWELMHVMHVMTSVDTVLSSMKLRQLLGEPHGC